MARFLLKLPGKYRFWVRFGLAIIPVVGILAAAFALPPRWSIPLVILLLAASWVLSKVIFKYWTILVMPGPSPDMERFWVGTCWCADDVHTFEGLLLGLVYKYKTAAKHAYQMLKTWNFGKYIDDDGNIHISVIREGEGRYSVFIYPGERVKSQTGAEMLTRARIGPKSEVKVTPVRFFMQSCLDYRGDKEKQRMVESLARTEFLLVNTFYIEGNRIEPYAKKPFRVKRFVVANRSDSPLGFIEDRHEWEDPAGRFPEGVVAMVERVRQNLPHA